MYEYKFVNKLNNKNKPKLKNFLSSLLIKVLLSILLLLIILIVLKIDKNSNQVIYKYLYEKNINFAYFNKLYQKYLGNIIPLEMVKKEEKVFSENITYTDPHYYKDGVSLTTSLNYLVPIIESGVVIFIGNKDDYNNTVIIQGVDGVNIWYGNVDNLNIKLYDYVSKGEFLGEVKNDTLYLLFEKGGKYLDYKTYLK